MMMSLCFFNGVVSSPGVFLIEKVALFLLLIFKSVSLCHVLRSVIHFVQIFIDEITSKTTHRLGLNEEHEPNIETEI